MWIGFVFSAVVLLELIRLNLVFFKGITGDLQFNQTASLEPADARPLITIVIPAKDESLDLERTVASILSSDYANFEVMLINDRSADDTLEIMNRLAGTDPRLKVVSIDELPHGWTGKTHAMFRAVSAASGDILLFTDADTVMDAQVLSKSFRYFKEHNLDMLSILPGFIKRGFIEDAIYPHMALGFFYFYPLPAVNDQNESPGLASGAFIMISREAYEKVGTWERFKDDVTEDVALGRAVKQDRMKLKVVKGGSLVRTKKFETISEVCRYWKRVYFGGLERNISKIVRLVANYAALLAILVFFMSSAALLIGGTDEAAAMALLIVSALAVVGIIFPTTVFIRNQGGAWIYGLASFLGIFLTFCVACSTLATILSRGKIEWKGSNYM
jgi:chlorobactene glucosyltransferase